MIVSVHLADAGLLQVPRALRQRPKPAETRGLSYAEPVLSLPLRERQAPRPARPRIGMIAAWDDDRALDEFLAGHPIAKRFAGGWHVRLEPVRLYGFWPGMPDLPKREQAVDEGGRWRP